jgi:hypothetical protein
MFRKLFSLIKENSVRRIHTNKELINLYRERKYYLRNQKRKIKMVTVCGKNVRERTVKKVFKNTPEGKGRILLESEERVVRRR